MGKILLDEFLRVKDLNLPRMLGAMGRADQVQVFDQFKLAESVQPSNKGVDIADGRGCREYPAHAGVRATGRVKGQPPGRPLTSDTNCSLPLLRPD